MFPLSAISGHGSLFLNRLCQRFTHLIVDLTHYRQRFFEILWELYQAIPQSHPAESSGEAERLGLGAAAAGDDDDEAHAGFGLGNGGFDGDVVYVCRSEERSVGKTC